MPNDKNPLDQLRQATATLRGNARDGARPASEKNSLAVVLKARAVAWLTGIDAALLTPSVFKSLSWLAVVLALLSAVFGAKWAAASCAISLAVLAHVGIAFLGNLWNVADSLAGVRETYRQDVQNGTEKKQPQPEVAHPTSAKIH